ncbi:tRNA pseudouridine38-40 synthase [Tenacibaculum sp. MAR_2009_124]|uniref:tRNA pseudouridine(38-40) synthase TruA n=1 Tax=Tenacibaculum sp. MAR_2009_124 TaxID=1250059 RepID=UPI00089B2613|nr:tRNA pseudouridine(38-40) synthase TruA [Tenacibaculum sp. MAR_2009_124]SEB68827.1 tRNA pseudouridine38-40 synthase [Tenacibaculum sp. MAR_2009_124]
MNYSYSYLVRVQYLGFRFHGWQKQPGLKTVHWAIDKTLKFVCKGIRNKSVGVGRTDAKVSSVDYAFQLFIDIELTENDFVNSFNINSPSDIRAVSMKRITDETFNIIQHPKIKEYRYYFSFGEKNHPYCAPFLTGVLEKLDIDEMKKGAKLFEGYHNFIRYCTKPSKDTKVERTINECVIVENTELSASFFPEKSYVLIIKGQGFLRNQIRLIMGALFELGKGNYDIDFIKESLNPKSNIDFMKTIAPSSGLHLSEVDFK